MIRNEANSNGGGRLCNLLSIVQPRAKNPTIWETIVHKAIFAF